MTGTEASGDILCPCWSFEIPTLIPGSLVKGSDGNFGACRTIHLLDELLDTTYAVLPYITKETFTAFLSSC